MRMVGRSVKASKSKTFKAMVFAWYLEPSLVIERYCQRNSNKFGDRLRNHELARCCIRDS